MIKRAKAEAVCFINGVIPCFETDGESMDVYIACK
ncbi:hypothetical protein SAMN04490370_1156 [Eubacterium ruminantium]|nr:hypothetical protein SAMN04490370_1156 [Eubacterium ruminantium]